MRKVSTILFCLLLFGIPSAQSKYHAQVDSALTLGLKCLLMNPQDLTFRNDYTEVDGFRLKLVDSLMKTPNITISEQSELAHFILIEGNLENILSSALVNTERRESKTTDVLFQQDTQPANSELKSHRKELSAFENKAKASKKLDQSLGDGISAVIDLVTEMFQIIYSRLIQGEKIAFLKQNVPTILLEDVTDEFKSPELLEREQKSEEKLAQEINSVAQTVSYRRWLEVLATRLVSKAEKLGYAIKANEGASIEVSNRANDIVFDEQTSIGGVIIGGKNSSHYIGSPVLIIDLGGDDTYQLSYDSSVGIQVILDFSGNDIYKAETDFALGSGFFGVGLLIDEEGDDTYLGKNFCLGSGLFGVGILIDKKGNDKYFGDTYTQGAGGWGIGILEDLEGSDTYNGALFSQGFGFVAGCGMLIDRTGSDNYFAGGKYKDVLRYKDHYISLSQGFAYGIRPYMSGGIGLLFDYSGNDNYNADIFAQGASYWWGWGGLYDKEGNDYYSCYQYAQGCGTHMTLGTLVDEAGDDIYRVNGVGQGCGHDYSAGILLDKAGNDDYYAGGLSQGAGNANGFGILIDQAGDDGYYVKEKSNTQGYGNPRREFGSIGLFLDLKGKDSYSGNGSEGTWWSIGSKWGIGLDLKEEDLKEHLTEQDLTYGSSHWFSGPKLKPFPELDWNSVLETVNLPDNDSLKQLVDSLFILASAGSVQHRDMVEPAKESLREMKENSARYLVRKLNSKDAREIQTLIEILGKMEKAALMPMVSALKSEDNWTVRNACRVLAELKDTTAVPYLLASLTHWDYQVRGYALTAIGNAKDTSAFTWVVEMLNDSVEVVRKSAAYALGESGDERGIDYLVKCFDDPHYSVRLVAAEALGKIGEKAVNLLKEQVGQASTNSDSRRSLSLLALGKTKTSSAADFLWKIYDEQNWRDRGTIIEELGQSDNVKSLMALTSLREKETHPFVLGKLDLVLNRYNKSD